MIIIIIIEGNVIFKLKANWNNLHKKLPSFMKLGLKILLKFIFHCYNKIHFKPCFEGM